MCHGQNLDSYLSLTFTILNKVVREREKEVDRNVNRMCVSERGREIVCVRYIYIYIEKEICRERSIN